MQKFRTGARTGWNKKTESQSSGRFSFTGLRSVFLARLEMIPTQGRLVHSVGLNSEFTAEPGLVVCRVK